MSECFTLITRRTKEQGQARYLGKDSPTYQDATTWIEMSAQDMARLGIADGDAVRVQTGMGQVDVPVRSGVLPAGLALMPPGPAANKLGDADTESTGMPLLKGFVVVIARRSPLEPT